MDFSQLTHSDDLIVENEKITGLIINEYDHFRIEKRYVSKTGEIIWVDLALAVMREEDKGPYYYVGVVNDISEQKQYEAELKERNFIKDKFFSIIAHDLRSQFSVIRGFSELLTTKDKFTEPERQKIIDSLHASSQNGLTLLEDLLEWSSSQLNKVEFIPEKLSLPTLIDNVLLVVKNQAILKQIEIVININHNHHVIVDKRMMNTVLRNLLENAIKFTPAGGQIIISAIIEKKYNIISVKDNGVGMPKDIIEKLFRIDHKHSTQGTEKEIGPGLGLILVREFIEKHDGKISVESELDKGSEFIITIPERQVLRTL
jgi:signal transduction histidine kinase